MKIPKLKLGDMVYVEWDDHCSSNNGWQRIGDDDDCFFICKVKTLGFVTCNNDQILKVALMMQKGNKVYSECINIIKSCITKIKKIKVQ